MNFSYQPRVFSFMRVVHDKLPPFKYHPLATDRLTQLFATWQWASDHIDWNTPWIPDEDRPKLEKCHDQVYEFHRRRFLRAFAKSQAKTEITLWRFGAAFDYLACPIKVLRHELVASYAAKRYWRQHIPNLP